MPYSYQVPSSRGNQLQYSRVAGAISLELCLPKMFVCRMYTQKLREALLRICSVLVPALTQHQGGAQSMRRQRRLHPPRQCQVSG